MRATVLLGSLAVLLTLGGCSDDDDDSAPPAQHLGSTRVNGGGEARAEISAFDPATHHLFITNGADARVDVMSLADPTAPAAAGSLSLQSQFADADPTSVAVGNGWVAVACADGANKQNNGVVQFWNSDTLSFITQVTAGALPDMVTVTPDGDKVLVANEGEPNDDYTNDPEGSITVIAIPASGPAALDASDVSTAGFGAFNSQLASLRAQDVRIFGPGATVAQDLEPEYIAVSADSTRAWVSLQENNALAVVNLATGAVTDIFPLGLKDWNDSSIAGLDASNRDGEINIRNWPVRGMYQPDAIAAYQVGGTNYVVSANEGDAREYDGYDEEARVADVLLDRGAFPEAATLQQEENLGRLKLTLAHGDTDGDGDYDEIRSYGARSFSIWNGGTGQLVYDSGSTIAEKTAAFDPDRFNADEGEFDGRSDDKGAEPEGVTVGQIGRRWFAFLGLERHGTVMVFDITDPTAPTFHTFLDGDGDAAPEGVLFISAADSPNGKPLLVVTYEDSGTIGVFQMKD